MMTQCYFLGELLTTNNNLFVKSIFVYITVSLILSSPMDDENVVKVTWFMSAAWKRHVLCQLWCWCWGFSFMLWYASQSSDMTAASQSYSCLPNREDAQLQTLSVTPRETKCKRDEERRWKRAKRKSDRELDSSRDWERWNREISQHSYILCRYFFW